MEHLVDNSRLNIELVLNAIVPGVYSGISLSKTLYGWRIENITTGSFVEVMSYDLHLSLLELGTQLHDSTIVEWVTLIDLINKSTINLFKLTETIYNQDIGKKIGNVQYSTTHRLTRIDEDNYTIVNTHGDMITVTASDDNVMIDDLKYIKLSEMLDEHLTNAYWFDGLFDEGSYDYATLDIDVDIVDDTLTMVYDKINDLQIDVFSNLYKTDQVETLNIDGVRFVLDDSNKLLFNMTTDVNMYQLKDMSAIETQMKDALLLFIHLVNAA